MKKTILICLALALAVSAGCGNKPEDNESSIKLEDEAKMASFIDPVDGKTVENIEEAKYSYVYDDVKYFFNSKKNYETFKENPEKYARK